MCGIIAISVSDNRPYSLNQSLQAISHRGPDDQGDYYSEGNDAQLGHVRLSIIDLSPAGHQPMFDSSRRYVIVFNGEIYNYLTLKKELEAKHGVISWKSSSDTEVILEGFVREGQSFFSKLNGIFAFSLYDTHEKEMYILRDPIGIKPLYITEQNGSVFFCSEIKGLLCFSELNRTIRRASLADQLAFMYVPEPYTNYNEFFRLKPGICYVYKQGRKIRESALFTHLNEPISFTSEMAMIEMLRETFSDSVKRQLIADVPVSLFLSGGLDSSAVAFEAVQAGGNIRSAYTISFTEEDSRQDGQSNDLYYARKMADKLGLKLEVIQAKSDLISMLPGLMPYLEDGVSDPAAINTFLISQSARADGVKVMLSGQGADEYLCGYRRYLGEKLIENINPLAKKGLSIVADLLPTSIPGRFNASVRRLKRLAVASSQSKRDRLPGYFMWGSPNQIKEFFLDGKDLSPGRDLYDFFDNHSEMESLSTMLLADQQFDLLSLNLNYTDKMSMLAGVEARVPFLDFEMVRLMNSIPLDMKIRGREQKYILKKAMEPKLPSEVIYRQKAGFALPIRSWFRKNSEITDKYLNSERLKGQGIYDVKAIANMLSLQFNGKVDYSYLLYSLLSQQIWLENQKDNN
jgi:asparagine synthase (glutamine-hydrolysing)